MPTTLLLATTDFWTFLRPCNLICNIISHKNTRFGSQICFFVMCVGADYFELSKTNSFIEYYAMIIRSVGRSENPGKGATNNVVGIICHPGWNRVSLPAKIWEGAMPS